jgi:four helix bundle protein
MRFFTYDLALDLIRTLREPLAAIRRHDAALAKQGRDALNSVALNIAEGSGRNGGDRQQHFAIAFGSLRELGSVLDIGEAHGWLEGQPCWPERDRLAGLLWSLKRR